MLTEAQKKLFFETYDRLSAAGKLYSLKQLQQFYATFQNRFGPHQLLKLSGSELLEVMHGHGNRESLVYWLEFKDDEEFPTRWFGSIAGGTALKFGLFRRKETGNWNAYGDDGKPKEISIDEAIKFAEKHRSELIRGIEEIRKIPLNGSDEDYQKLQATLDSVAPSVSKVAWGHKYFHLLCPDRIDDFHSPEWQRFHLLKLLQEPPAGDGRYVCAGPLVRLANEVGLPIPIVDTVLGEMSGPKHRYWRIGTSDGKKARNQWDQMKQGQYVAVGWDGVGDISPFKATTSNFEATTDAHKRFNELLLKAYPDMVPSVVGRSRTQLLNFLNKMAVGDYVLAADGSVVIAVGRITGEYRFDPMQPFHHHRPVQWLSFEEWQMPDSEGLQTTLHEMKKAANILQAELAAQSGSVPVPDRLPPPSPVVETPKLTGIPGRIQSILQRKAQVILYGPPGTGKTYWAERAARELAAYSAFGLAFENLNDEQKVVISGSDQSNGLVRICCFHPTYGYEDFIEGFRPETIDGQITFELRPGIFRKLCADAAKSPKRSFYLIIDEINRGDIPRIFGELLTVIESDKRGKQIVLPLSHSPFSVPPNVFLIGTMNTADRSISLLDAALRRRFGFIELMPDSGVLRGHSIAGFPLVQWFDALNRRICQHVGRDARNLQIGHSYLLQNGLPVKDVEFFRGAVLDDIIPLLEEYCYEDFQTLQNILGTGLFDLDARRIRHDLFNDGMDAELLQALLQPCPEIATSLEALVAVEASTDDDSEIDAAAEGDR